MFTHIILHLDSIKCTNNSFTLPVYWSDTFFSRLPIASHGLCTCCPNTLNARKYFLKKCPHQYQQTGHLLLRRWPKCRIYGLLSRSRWGEWGCREVTAPTLTDSKWTIVDKYTNIPASLEKRNLIVFVLFKYDAGCFQWFLWMEELWQIEMLWLVDITFQRMWVWFFFCLNV